jgi:hypothetical protein
MGYGINRQRGDYGRRYRGRRGDFLGSLGSILGTVGKVATSLVPGGALIAPAIGVAGAIKNIVAPTSPKLPSITQLPMNAEVPITALPSFGHKRRRMNPGNTKALNRAIRRVSSFGSLVARSKKSVAKANRALNPSRGTRRAPKVC